MENTQLISLSRQIALQRQMDVVANNIANINTTGFKAQDVLFEEYVMPVARDRSFAFPDQPLSYTQDWATVHNFTEGALTETGNPLDLALHGDGFLTVATPAGERWTRAGALQIDTDGVLVTGDGHPVLSNGGPIRFEAGETDFAITANGTVTTTNGAKGQLRIVEFDNPQLLTREGANLFAGGTPLPATRTSVIQGAIERSNVSSVTEMAQMIRVQRAYQSLATLMQQQSDLRTAAVRRLGSLSA